MTISTVAAAAANAYAATSKMTARAAPAPRPDAGAGFADLVQQTVGSLVETGAQADKASMAAVSGKADIVDVVTAVAESELAIETLVSVRDRVISAYEEIMRMPI